MSRRTMLIVSVALTAFILMIAGGLIGNMSQAGNTVEPSTVNTSQTALPQENTPGTTNAPELTSASTSQISEEQAIQAATTYLGGGTVAEVALDQSQGPLAYAVVFADGNEVYVDAQTGEVFAASNVGGWHEEDEDESDEEYEHEAGERENYRDSEHSEREH